MRVTDSALANASPDSDALSSRLSSYYKLHSAIYDMSRWSFLFGRTDLIRRLAPIVPSPSRILEVGCGTGINLEGLRKIYPKAHLCGIDLSSEMLEKAKGRMKSDTNLNLTKTVYDRSLSAEGQDKFDLVVFSYCLSMINPGWMEVLNFARKDLKDGGHIAVVDFNSSSSNQFRAWMRVNHVEMTGELSNALESNFTPVLNLSKNAYFGLWKYILFVGRKN